MAVYKALLFLSLLEIVVGDDVDINYSKSSGAISGDVNLLGAPVNPTKRCIATATQIGNCHVCACKTDGVFHCRGTKCDMYKTTDTAPVENPALTNRANSDINSLPEIRVGEPCIPDRLYKMECNRCRCTKDQSLMCTKMACFNWKDHKPKEEKKALRDDGSNKKGKSYLPKVQKGMPCKPGKLYRSECKRCYCTEENKLVCSKKSKEACTFDKYGNPPPIQKPEDIHPNIQLSGAMSVPRLHSASEQCSPGKSYKVDCNMCLCMDTRNLLCQKKLCLSYDDMNRIEAKDMSGKTCNSDNTLKSSDCKTCKCVDSKTVCTAVPGCANKPNMQQLLGKEAPPEEMDPETDKIKCLPHTIYKIDCNKCYCQVDGSLRCTQKTCLNYSQVKLLEVQREYLERHGL